MARKITFQASKRNHEKLKEYKKAISQASKESKKSFEKLNNVLDRKIMGELEDMEKAQYSNDGTFYGSFLTPEEEQEQQARAKEEALALKEIQKNPKILKCISEFQHFTLKYKFLNDNNRNYIFMAQLKEKAFDDIFKNKYKTEEAKAIKNIVLYLEKVRKNETDNKLTLTVWTNDNTNNVAMWWLQDCLNGFSKCGSVWEGEL